MMEKEWQKRTNMLIRVAFFYVRFVYVLWARAQALENGLIRRRVSERERESA